MRWVCANCRENFLRNEIDIDHIEPCIPLDRSASSMSLKEIYNRTFTSVNNLQILCKPCHKIKNSQESKIRAEFRKLRKPKIAPKNKKEK